ncbi:hypothetical protein BDD12DRAFT_46479 [Trichophaea hybrida]|nr:hypothetical protein BDD12DRAFT_46479 [Trichophaea hybrida]
MDQASRTLLLALVMFAVRPPVETRSEYAVLYFFITMRGVIGVTVVGLTRSIFLPVCFPSADTVSYGRAPGITALFFDGTIMAVSVVRALGVYRGGKRGREEVGLILVVVASLGWSIAAAPYQLRAGSIFVRLSPGLITLSILLGEDFFPWDRWVKRC